MNTLSLQYGHTMNTRHPLGDAPIGQQLLVHYARRDAVRHATPLFPSSWAELLAPFRNARLRPLRAAAHAGRAQHDDTVCQAG